MNAETDLRELMREISETAWSAGWMQDLEYSLWGYLENGSGAYGHMEIDDDLIRRLDDLSREAGGWFVYGPSGEQFVPLDRWKELYRAWKRG